MIVVDTARVESVARVMVEMLPLAIPLPNSRKPRIGTFGDTGGECAGVSPEDGVIEGVDLKEDDEYEYMKVLL